MGGGGGISSASHPYWCNDEILRICRLTSNRIPPSWKGPQREKVVDRD
jgi:hypothetical protein